jgi:hypothetical protein
MNSLPHLPSVKLPTLSKNPKRSLDLAHLVFASLWLGGFMIMFCLSIMIMNGSITEAFGAAAIGLIKSVITICIPALMLTGLIYSLFTKWGFKKHGWVVAKWLLSIAVVACTALAPAKPACLAGVIAGMLILFAISVFKPRKKAKITAAH